MASSGGRRSGTACRRAAPGDEGSVTGVDQRPTAELSIADDRTIAVIDEQQAARVRELGAVDEVLPEEPRLLLYARISSHLVVCPGRACLDNRCAGRERTRQAEENNVVPLRPLRLERPQRDAVRLRTADRRCGRSRVCEAGGTDEHQHGRDSDATPARREAFHPDHASNDLRAMAAGQIPSRTGWARLVSNQRPLPLEARVGEGEEQAIWVKSYRRSDRDRGGTSFFVASAPRQISEARWKQRRSSATRIDLDPRLGGATNVPSILIRPGSHRDQRGDGKEGVVGSSPTPGLAL